MKKRAEAAAAGHDLNHVDKTAIIFIWAMIALIIIQAFLKNTGKQVSVTIEALAVGLLVTGLYFFKVKRFLKSLLIGVIPALAIFVVIFTNSYSLDRHYMLCLLLVIIALYLDKKLLLVYGAILNVLLIGVFLLRPDHLLGPDNGIPYFLSIFFMYNGELLALYFLTKWGQEVLVAAQRSRDELQGHFDKAQTASAVREKQAGYMEAGVQSLLKGMDKLSQGELDFDIAIEAADADTASEHALLAGIATKLHESVAGIRGYIAEAVAVLERVSDGYLRLRVEGDFKGDFAALKHWLNSIITSLNGMMLDINIAAEQVASGTRQVSDGSQAISQGAAEQAASIDELTASIAEIASQTRDNAAKADRANELSSAAKENARRGSARMEELQTAMKSIDDASSDITKIIKVIDEIAFQTNILALNAAVEAARAGVHGKGFAVVAEEVRNLAGKSAEAARETASLIEGSAQKTTAGSRLADETARELGGIVEAVERTAGFVSEIAIASNAQATAILQVNRGIEQMSNVVQQNSATSEEAAAAGEELSAQAQLLKTKVESFVLS